MGTESQPQSAEPIATPVRNTKFDSPKNEQPSTEIAKTPSAEVTACEPTNAADSKIPEVANEGSKAAPVEPPQPGKVDPPLAEQATAPDRKAM